LLYLYANSEVVVFAPRETSKNCALLYHLFPKVVEPLRKIVTASFMPVTLPNEVHIQVTLQLVVSQPVCLGVEPPSGTHDQI
jgi:hypothetical protein